jgi:hypothetical protein
LATGQRGVLMRVGVRGDEEVIEEARPLVLGERRLAGGRPAPRPHCDEVSQLGRDYPGERPRDQVGQRALVNGCAQRVPVGLDELVAGLHRVRDDQIRLDGVLQRCEQGGLRPASQQLVSQPHQVRGAQGCQRPATALPTLHAGHVHTKPSCPASST